jgi:hypothetical protein
MEPIRFKQRNNFVGTIQIAATEAVNYYAQPRQAELYASGFPSGNASSQASQMAMGTPDS